MSWDMNVYYNPEKFGLLVVGEIEFSSGSYEFDTLVVWADEKGGLYYAEDSGCSCPCPFESFGRDTITPAKPKEILSRIKYLIEERESWGRSYVTREDIHRLKAAMNAKPRYRDEGTSHD